MKGCGMVGGAWRWRSLVIGFMAALYLGNALAGPPYVADDPEPTDFQHYEIYFLAAGENNRGGRQGAAGLDFNYGGAPNLQLTAVFPIAYEHASVEPAKTGLGNIELAAKYRFLHQQQIGWDVAVFPRVFVNSASRGVGTQHTSLLLPFWVQKDWVSWSTFGGGGCVYNRGGDSQDFCLAAWAVTRQFTTRLQLGAEISHQTPDTRGGKASTGSGIGMHFDINENLHWLAYGAPGLQNAAETARYSWYTSLLLTF